MVNVMLSAPRPVVLVPAIAGVALREVVVQADPVASGFGKVAAFGRESVFLLLVVILIPVGVLVIGTPIALIVRTLIEIAKRF
jgi:hypothetical protein